LRNIFKNKFFLFCLFLIFSGILFGYLETTFYQYIDLDGVLHESLFLPLSVFSILTGIFGLIFIITRQIFLEKKKVKQINSLS